MSVVARQVIMWGPVLIRYLPQIISVGHKIYSLWCDIRNNKKQNDTVLRSMKLLNQHQDDIDRLLQDPERKRELLEGLTILMNRINEHTQQQTGQRGNIPPHSSPFECFTPEKSGASSSSSSSSLSSSTSSSSVSSSSKSAGKIGGWKVCEVCYMDYNRTNRKPTLLFCGHTFCRDCLENEVHHRRILRCPKCKALENRPLSALPLNYSLMGNLEEKDQDDDACCSMSGGGSSSCEETSLTFEQQIEYAIQLSQQQAQSHGSSFVEKRWQEVLEAEDEMLARALQESEIFEASRLCAQQVSKGATRSECSPDEGKGWGHECAKIKWDEHDCRKGEEKKEKENCCAMLLEEEDLLLQMGICASECAEDECTKSTWDEQDCRKGEEKDKTKCAMLLEEEDIFLHMAIKASQEECAEDECTQSKWDEQNCRKGEEEEDEEKSCAMPQEEEEKEVCCAMPQEEGDKEECCTVPQEEEDKEKCYAMLREENKKNYCALLQDEEDLLIQMAIRASLQPQNSCTPLFGQD